MEYYSHSTEETERLGTRLARYLKAGDIICLSGELGSGKTTLVKGIAQGLEIPAKEVSSPTFTLMNVYGGKMPVFHFDLYRVKQSQEMSFIGYEEYFYGKGVSVVEWAEKLGELLPSDYINIKIFHRQEYERLLKISAKGTRSKQIVRRLKL